MISLRFDAIQLQEDKEQLGSWDVPYQLKQEYRFCIGSDRTLFVLTEQQVNIYMYQEEFVIEGVHHLLDEDDITCFTAITHGTLLLSQKPHTGRIKHLKSSPYELSVFFQTRSSIASRPRKSSVKYNPLSGDLFVPTYSHTYLTIGSPLLSLYAIQKEQKTLDQKVFSFAKSLWQEEKQPAILKFLGALDESRTGLFVTQAPINPKSHVCRLCVVGDSLGRLLLVDGHEGHVIRIFKGMRDCQVGWIRVESDLLLCIYSKKGQVEVYLMPFGERLQSIQTPTDLELVQAGSDCYLVSQKGQILQLLVDPEQLHAYQSQSQLKRDVVSLVAQIRDNPQSLERLKEICLSSSQSVLESLHTAPLEYLIDLVDQVDIKFNLPLCQVWKTRIQEYQRLLKNHQNLKLLEPDPFTHLFQDYDLFLTESYPEIMDVYQFLSCFDESGVKRVLEKQKLRLFVYFCFGPVLRHLLAPKDVFGQHFESKGFLNLVLTYLQSFPLQQLLSQKLELSKWYQILDYLDKEHPNETDKILDFAQHVNEPLLALCALQVVKSPKLEEKLQKLLPLLNNDIHVSLLDFEQQETKSTNYYIALHLKKWILQNNLESIPQFLEKWTQDPITTGWKRDPSVFGLTLVDLNLILSMIPLFPKEERDLISCTLYVLIIAPKITQYVQLLDKKGKQHFFEHLFNLDDALLLLSISQQLVTQLSITCVEYTFHGTLDYCIGMLQYVQAIAPHKGLLIHQQLLECMTLLLKHPVKQKLLLLFPDFEDVLSNNTIEINEQTVNHRLGFVYKFRAIDVEIANHLQDMFSSS
ncbi:hypothetical protein EDD86DRAFT_249472 [Gorgonomyces haynaldii]|nr:hypothetical protein EDD86DRAFT_249472 [Gorgonomyces haynaldii]